MSMASVSLRAFGPPLPSEPEELKVLCSLRAWSPRLGPQASAGAAAADKAPLRTSAAAAAVAGAAVGRQQAMQAKKLPFPHHTSPIQGNQTSKPLGPPSQPSLSLSCLPLNQRQQPSPSRHPSRPRASALLLSHPSSAAVPKLGQVASHLSRLLMWNGAGPTRRPVRTSSFPLVRSPRYDVVKAEADGSVGSAAQVVAVEAPSPVQDKTLVWNEVEYSPDGMGVAAHDPLLNTFDGHLRYRYSQFLRMKRALDKAEKGLEHFSLGYKFMGFQRDEEDKSIVYREWAPAAIAAQLVGDFNGWNGGETRMERNQFGVWSVRIPDRPDGAPAIPHGSRVKVRLQRGDGGWVDRIPAWIKWAKAEPGKMGATYDGIYWDPPEKERYQFKCPRPPKPKAPRIYEAHVGMSSEEPKVSSYVEFANEVLPRIKAGGYNTVQLMAVMEHSYYASFGYHVTNFFAVSSRSGTPEDLKYLVDMAHSLGLRVLMDVVHSHASNNVSDGLNGFDFGQRTEESYFHCGERGYHSQWDSRCFNYSNWEVLRFLLSNLRWWLEEYQFDGFRFDGVTSMLYHHHGLNMSFTGDYHEYFSTSTDVDAVVYLMLANDLVHGLFPEATMVAEDVSGMPTLGLPVPIGGIGFDYRLAMAIPDRWIEYLKDRTDEQWSMGEIVHTLTNRRYVEKCIAYAESHDQCMVGDKSFAFLLMEKDMYFNMSVLQPPTPAVERGIALHKMVHFLSMALGGDGYLNFMGNEFGHPEWVDFPREGNKWSYDKCRRMWSLADADHLRYKLMLKWDRAMNELDEKFSFLSAEHQLVSSASDKDKVIVFERGDLLFVFNFHPTNTYEGYKVGCKEPGKFRIALDSDSVEFGGQGRVGHEVDHFSSPEGIPGKPETNFNNRCASILVLAPSRSCQVYSKAE